jgi:hypothetical protein
MSLKLKVEKLDDVSEAHRALYTEDKDGGGYVLGVEGLEDTGALKRAKEHEVNERKKAEARAKALEDEKKTAEEARRKAAEDAARAAGDTKALEESWKKKYADDLAAKDTEYTGKLSKQDATIRRLLVSDVASKIASELALPGSSGPLAQLISGRLAVEERDGDHVTVVRDLQGKPSALTLDDLRKEISNDKALAPLLVGSKGSGGGAGGSKGGGAAGAKTKSRAEFDALSQNERMAFSKDGGTVTD